jgi:uncharacterized repeat protein (TIGR03803 family)
MRPRAFARIALALGFTAGATVVLGAALPVKKSVVYSFAGQPDGHGPEAGVIAVGGTLYGTTAEGGSYGYGTVFSLTEHGDETVLHSFDGYTDDGVTPSADLLNVRGTLYGTTSGGGASGVGTVFSISANGQYSELYQFKGQNGDGQEPYDGLVNVCGVLYGTTVYGGKNGLGTIFSITSGGVEKVIYSFAGTKDGAYPQAGLIAIHDILYGTASAGGPNCGSYGCGTLFRITKAGVLKVLHAFGSNTKDGFLPVSRLTYLSMG